MAGVKSCRRRRKGRGFLLGRGPGLPGRAVGERPAVPRLAGQAVQGRGRVPGERPRRRAGQLAEGAAGQSADRPGEGGLAQARPGELARLGGGDPVGHRAGHRTRQRRAAEAAGPDGHRLAPGEHRHPGHRAADRRRVLGDELARGGRRLLHEPARGGRGLIHRRPGRLQRLARALERRHRLLHDRRRLHRPDYRLDGRHGMGHRVRRRAHDRPGPVIHPGGDVPDRPDRGPGLRDHGGELLRDRLHDFLHDRAGLHLGHDLVQGRGRLGLQPGHAIPNRQCPLGSVRSSGSSAA